MTPEKMNELYDKRLEKMAERARRGHYSGLCRLELSAVELFVAFCKQELKRESKKGSSDENVQEMD